MKNTLKASSEFVLGKYEIGYVSSSFEERFGDKEFEEVKGTLKYQKLPRTMNDEEIERDLKPGICSLGDVLAFLENPPEESKDGYWNLFYFPDCVVYVFWLSGFRYWYVCAWLRGDDRWCGDGRVFSPATDLGSSESIPSDPSEPLSLEIKELKLKVGDKEITFVPKQ